METSYEIGTIINGKLLGRKQNALFIWAGCDSCGIERWVLLSWLSKQDYSRCNKCSHTKNGHGLNWQGGKVKGGGKGSPYIMVWLKPDNFFYPMVISCRDNGGGYVKEHRLVMAQHLGRCLQSWEIVHHINGIKTDNRLKNLQLTSDIGHKQISLLLREIARLEKENQQLRFKK